MIQTSRHDPIGILQHPRARKGIIKMECKMLIKKLL